MDKETGPIVYEEHVRWGPWLKVLVVSLLLLMFFLMVFSIFAGTWTIFIIYAVVILSIAFLMMNFWKLDFLITDKEVRFGFGIFIKVLPRSRISSCEPYQLRFRYYLGYGIRYGFDGMIAYNTRNGRGVKIVIEGKKRPYVLSLDKPERVCQILRSKSSGSD